MEFTSVYVTLLMRHMFTFAYLLFFIINNLSPSLTAIHNEQNLRMDSIEELA